MTQKQKNSVYIIWDKYCSICEHAKKKYPSDSDYFGGIIRKKGKLFFAPVEKRLMAMESRCRRNGFWVDNISPRVYVRFI